MPNSDTPIADSLKEGDTVQWINGKGETVTKIVQLDSRGFKTVNVFGMLCDVDVIAENRKNFKKV